MAWSAPVTLKDKQRRDIFRSLGLADDERARTFLARVERAIAEYLGCVEDGEHKPHPIRLQRAELERLERSLREVRSAMAPSATDGTGLHEETRDRLYELRSHANPNSEGEPWELPHPLHDRLCDFDEQARFLCGRVVFALRELEDDRHHRGGRRSDEAANRLAWELSDIWVEANGREPNLSKNTGSYRDFVETVFRIAGVETGAESVARGIVKQRPTVRPVMALLRRRGGDETDPE